MGERKKSEYLLGQYYKKRGKQGQRWARGGGGTGGREKILVQNYNELGKRACLVLDS